MKKILSAITLFAMIAALFSGCANIDVVLKYSPGSFKNITEKFPNLITDSTTVDHYYSMSYDSETKLKISHDYEMTGADDIMIGTPLKPFTDAGLDVSKLGSGYKVIDNMLYLTAEYGNGSGMKENVTDSMFESVKSDRSVLTYHQKLDHYGIKLPAGKFEWAKDYKTNDKDLVFVIKAKPLKDLGVDVNSISGWTLTTVQDNDGSNVDVLLKAYNLDSK